MTEQDVHAESEFDAFQRQVVEEFRANGGRVGGMFEGSTLALLTTTGARTGQRRTTPLAYLNLEGTPAVVASAMGGPKHPAWYFNVLANPMVTVEDGREVFDAVASAPTGIERDRLFEQVVAQDPDFGAYQERTTRVIPVVTLQRVQTPTTWSRGMGDFIVESHDWLRAELDELGAQVDRIAAGEADRLATGAQPLGLQMRSHCLEFCAALTRHHTGEDMGAFPLLTQQFPGLAPTVAKLVDEHLVVGQLHEELRMLIEHYEPGRSDPDHLRSEVNRLRTELENHFRYEERTLVTALNALGPAPEID
ncbi:MAG: nitroreductase/quinone reductase family protein [Dermatophilaceae bacterium]